MSDLIKTDMLGQIQSLEKAAELISRSALIPTALKNKPGDVLVIFMIARELDIPPMQALNGINVIQGKPAISPQLMIALIRRKMPNAYIDIKSEENKCTCTMARDRNSLDQAFTSMWDMDKAKKMMLLGKDNYIKQAGTMLKWRSVGEAARTVFPDVLAGLYFPDEFQDGSLNIDENGELLPPPKPKNLLYFNSIITSIKNLSCNYQNKDALNDLIKQYGTSKEIANLSEERQKEISRELMIVVDQNKEA